MLRGALSKFLDYMQAMVDSGLDTVEIPEEYHKIYIFMRTLTETLSNSIAIRMIFDASGKTIDDLMKNSDLDTE